MALHKDLTGANLHEPKGVSAASSGQVYAADGAGSGAWTTLAIPSGTFLVTCTQFTASGTWTKPANLFAAKVTVIGAGGGNGTSGSGTGGTPTGGTSSFGSYVSATGGSYSTGGTSADGDFVFAGQNRESSAGNGWGNPAEAGLKFADYGKSSYFSSGGPGSTSSGGGGAISWLTGAELTSTVTVTIGAPGTVGSGTHSGGGGLVLVEEYIKVT